MAGIVMRRIALLLILIFIVGFSFKAVGSVKADSTPKYTYVSDTERWYYEKQAYERPYLTWIYYPYYYNATNYDILYYPYYTMGYSYRNVKVYEYYLTVKTDLPGVSVTGEGWYREGSSASISAEKTFDLGGETRYHFTHWSGDFSGISPSGTVTIDRAKTVVANYEASHHLQVVSTPLEAFGVMEDNWYKEGETRILQSAPETIEAGQGRRYVFEAWYVDGVRTAGNPISVKVDEPHIVEAKYGMQYYLDVKSLYGDPQGAGWYDEGVTAVFEVSTPVEAGTGRKWIFDQWGGDVVTSSPRGTVIMDSPKMVTATWRLDSTMLYAIYGLIIAAATSAIVVLTLLFTRPGGALPRLKATQQCLKCGYGLAGGFQYCPICGSKRATTPKSTGKNR